MNVTINSTRVLITGETVPDGISPEISPAPATLGVESNPASLDRTYERVPLNSPRRGIPDGEEERPSPPSTNQKLLKCTKNTILSTFNTRTLGSKGSPGELAQCAHSNAIDIIAVMEQRFHHPDNPIQYKSVGKYQLVTSSGTKNACNATVGGIEVILSHKAVDNLLRVESIS